MPDEFQFVSDSLEELLVSIADGVRDAQQVLSSTPPLDAYGRALPSYHLPYLDFELKVGMETVSHGHQRKLLIASTQSSESTLSGRLVAIPPGEGLPTPMLLLSSTRLAARRHTISISATNTAGEILSGQVLELNLNLEASNRLSAAAGVELNSLRAGTALKDALLTTDESGRIETELSIAPGLPAKAVVVVTAEIGTQSASLSVPAGGGA